MKRDSLRPRTATDLRQRYPSGFYAVTEAEESLTVITDERRRRSTRPLTSEEEVFYAGVRRRINELRRDAVLDRSEMQLIDDRRSEIRANGALSYSWGAGRGLTWGLFYRRLTGIWSEPRYTSDETLKKHLSPGARGRIDLLELPEYAEALRVPVDLVLPTRSREQSEPRYLRALASLSRRQEEITDYWHERIELSLQLDDLIEYAESRGFSPEMIDGVRQQLFELKVDVGRWQHVTPE